MQTDLIPRDDGAMQMFVWQPPERPRGAVLVIQEIFGVGPYISAVAERLAAEGFVVGAPDVFWRFAPGWASDHSETGFAASVAKVQQLDFELAVGDCAAALQALATRDDLRRAPAVLGFCLGGSLAWGVAAAAAPSCCVSYYGSRVPAMVDLIDQITCPTLLHFGNTDAYIPSDSVEAVSAAIAGRGSFMVNVEDAGHAFDNHEAPMFWNEAAARAAWAKTLTFLTEHS